MNNFDYFEAPLIYQEYSSNKSSPDYQEKNGYNNGLEQHSDDEIEVVWQSSETSPKSEGNKAEVKKNSKKKKDYANLPQNAVPTMCVVCGDTAAGYHYEVASCNGCKTFFRRTILQERTYECRKGGKCFEILPKEHRCACRSCRFNKCIDAGMNPLAIHMTAEQRKNSTMKEIMQKRPLPIEEFEPSTSKELRLIPTKMLTLSDKVQRLLEELSYLEIRTERYRASEYNPDPKLLNLDDLLQATNSLSLADKLQPMPNWPIEQSELCRKRDPNAKLAGNVKNWLFFDLLSSIEYAKTFPFFHRLPSEDKKKLVQTVSLSCCNLTQAFTSFSQQASTIVHPDGTVPPPFIDRKKHRCGDPQMTNREHKKYAIPKPDRSAMVGIFRRCLNTLHRIQITEKEYLLVKAMVLCNAGALDLSDFGKRLILDEQRRIGEALMNYCMTTFGLDGPARYAVNISLIDTLERMAMDQRNYHTLCKIYSTGPPDPNRFTRPRYPLVEEVLDN